MLISLTSPLVLAQTQDDAPPAETSLQTTASSKPAEPPFNLYNTRLTGDWWIARTWLEDNGIEYNISLTAIFQHNVHGGVQTRNGHRITGSFDTELVMDTQKMGLWKGGTFYAFTQTSWADSIGEDRVGSFFDVNGDAAGDYAVYVTDLWYEHTFWNGRARLRVGKSDLGVDFDANAYANSETSQFLNDALINTGNLPFPSLGIGVQMIVQPNDWFYFGVVAADAQAQSHETGLVTTFHNEDYFFTDAEFGFMPVWETPIGKLPGAYRVGLWYDPQPKEVFFNDLGGRRRTIPMKRDDIGFYFNMDQVLYKEVPDSDADSQGLGMFFRYSYASEECNEIEHFWSVGAQYQGLIPTRDDDVLGFGFAQGIMSDKLRDLGGGDRESVYELYYNTAVFPWLTITPDFQYIVNPGANGGHDAFVVGLRMQMIFWFFRRICG